VSGPPDQEFTMSHNHHDHSDTPAGSSITFAEKAEKLIAHWIKHNEDHAQSYGQWADAFRDNGLASAAVLLESAADLTRRINQALIEASRAIEP
jgi:hypothetical protein